MKLSWIFFQDLWRCFDPGYSTTSLGIPRRQRPHDGIPKDNSSKSHKKVRKNSHSQCRYNTYLICDLKNSENSKCSHLSDVAIASVFLRWRFDIVFIIMSDFYCHVCDWSIVLRTQMTHCLVKISMATMAGMISFWSLIGRRISSMVRIWFWGFQGTDVVSIISNLWRWQFSWSMLIILSHSYRSIYGCDKMHVCSLSLVLELFESLIFYTKIIKK